MGIFPRVVDADNDGLKDLLIGQAEGNLKLYMNINTDEEPLFDAGTLLQTGEPGLEVDIDVGQRATPVVTDWNGDGRRDIVAGNKAGLLNIFINTGSDSAWEFEGPVQYVKQYEFDMVVPSYRPSPHIADLDGDGRKDLLTGNTEGQLLFWSNAGTDDAPYFTTYEEVESDGVPIDLPGIPRSRPFVCDWNGDGLDDVLIGAGDGLVRLYLGMLEATGDDGPPATAASLLPPYPNPFNPVVTIPVVLDSERRISVSVYDVSGKRIAVVASGYYPAGTNEFAWRGEDSHGRSMQSGIYLIRLESGGTVSSVKAVLLR